MRLRFKKNAFADGAPGTQNTVPRCFVWVTGCLTYRTSDNC
jgi:hypothetical protein